ncbi:MAG TPA: hypothetical protein VLA64_14535 [Azonexus sp.]|nr:hypothetical protein [Azonexus sp.]
MRHSLLRLLALALFLPLLGACASRGIPQPMANGEHPEARVLLQKSAEAHGLSAWLQISDLSVSYAGEWRSLVSRLQPTLIDADFRQASEERLLLGPEPIYAQQHQGPKGSKQVIRSGSDVSVFYNGTPSADPEVQAAAALVADGYRMFLTGPFYFLTGNLQLELAGSDSVEGRLCDLIVAVRRPGNGLSAEDRYLLYIDRENGLLRRVRFSLEGLSSTQGAVAEVDFFDHRQIAGVTWPTRFFERLRKPIPNLPVHDWRLIGLEVNRGFAAVDVNGAVFSGKARVPAKRLD